MDVDAPSTTSDDALANESGLCVVLALLWLKQNAFTESIATTEDAVPNDARGEDAGEPSLDQLYEAFALLLRSELLDQGSKDDAGGGIGVGDATENECVGHLLLSWAPIIGCPYKVRVDGPDTVYQLYQDCLCYLKNEYPICTWTSSIVEDISEQPAMQQRRSSHYGTLINLLADHYNERAKKSSPTPTSSTTRCLDSMPEFILYGIEAVSNSPWVRRALGPPPGSYVESDLYQALFLGLVDSWLNEECRARLMAEWSPMYWSRASRQEIIDRAYGSGFWSQPLRKLRADELTELGAGQRSLQAFGSFVGYPTDIPWFGGPHDNYPFCGTWSTYTAIRSRAPQNFQADLALWVSAMTFGLLEAVTHMQIPESVLIIPGTGGRTPVLSGQRILQFFTFWHRRFHSCKENRGERHGREVARILHRALDALDEEVTLHNGVFGRAGLCDTQSFQTTVCAIGSTVLSLCVVSAVHCWIGLPEMRELLYLARRPRLFTAHMLVEYGDKMVNAGWCPTVPPALLSTTSMILPPSSYLIQLPPFIRSMREEHRDCTPSACTLYTITDTAAYVPRHVDPSCHCEYTRPSLDDVMGLLSDGVIPAVVFDGSGLRVQPAEHGSYIAISHVWADGMGSTTDIGLPTCVVKRIAGLARMLLPSGAFWMDSLCVPRLKELRKRAIKLMAHTYRDAAKVLVIDGIIRAQCSRGKSWQENLVRIATSGWVRRVWTLQEAMLARELHFEFIEGPVNVEEDLQLKHWSRWHTSVFGREAEDAFTDVPFVCWSSRLTPMLMVRAMRSGTDIQMSLEVVVAMLHQRTSTERKDEIVAISSLLTIDLDLDALLALDGPDAAQERMKMFLLQLRCVPRNLPMIETQRLTVPGFRWAPLSLASWGSTESVRRGSVGVCSEEGLLAEYWVGLLDKPLPVLPLGAESLDTYEHNSGVPNPIDPSELHSLLTYISHRPPGDAEDVQYGVTYPDRWISGYPSLEPQSVDAFLFLHDEDMSARTSLTCVAARIADGSAPYVCRDDDDSSTAIGSSQNPMRFRYVAVPNLFHYPACSAEELSQCFEGARMDKLRKKWVQLT